MAYGNYKNPTAYTDKFGNTGIQGPTGRYGSTVPAAMGPDLNQNGYFNVAADTDVTLVTGESGTNRRLWSGMFVNFSGIGSEDFNVAASNGNHATFENCNFRIANPGGLTTSNLFITLNDTNAGHTGWGSGNPANSYSCNLVNCDIDIIQTTGSYVFDVLADDVIDCNITVNNFNNSGSFGNWSVKQDAEIRDSTFSTMRRHTTSAGGLIGQTGQIPGLLNVRGLPRVFSNLVFQNYAPFISSTGSFLMVSPNFTDTDQLVYMSSNSTTGDLHNGDKGIVTVGPFLWAQNAASNSSTSAFASKIWWGNDPTGTTTGQHFIQNYGFNPTSVEDLVTLGGAQGVRYYVQTNMPGNVDTASDTGAGNFASRFNTTTARTSPVTNCYVTDTDGKLVSERYRLNDANNWTSGFVNWTQMQVDTSSGSANMTQNFNSQSAGDHVIASPIQAARKTVGGASNGRAVALNGITGLYTKIDIRGYAYSNGTDTETITVASLTNNGSNYGSFPIVERNVCDPPSPWVKASNIVSTNKASGTTILGKFPASPAGQVTYNDIHDLARFLWSDFQAENVPGIDGNVAVLNCLQTGFDSSGTRIDGKGSDTECVIANTSDTDTLIWGAGEAVRGIECTNNWDLGGMQLRGGYAKAATFENPVTSTTEPSDPANWPEDAAFGNMEISGQIAINPGNSDTYIVGSNLTLPSVSDDVSFTNRRAAGQTGRIIIVGDWPGTTVPTYPLLGTPAAATAQVVRYGSQVITVQNDLDTEIRVGYGTATSSTANPTWGNSVTVGAGERHSFTEADFTNNTRVVMKMCARGFVETGIQNTDIIVNIAENQLLHASDWLAPLAYNKDAPLGDTDANTTEHLNVIASSATLANQSGLNGTNQSIPSGLPFENTSGLTKLFLSSPNANQGAQSPSLILQPNVQQTLRLLMDLKEASSAVSTGYLRVMVENRTDNVVGGFNSTTPYIDRRYVLFASEDVNDNPYVTGIADRNGTLLEESEISALLTVTGRTSLVRNLVNPGGLTPANLLSIEQAIEAAITASENDLSALIRRENRSTRAKIDPLY